MSTRGLIAAARLLTISHTSIKWVTNSKKIALFGAIALLSCVYYICVLFNDKLHFILYFAAWVCLELRTDIILFLPQLYHSPKPLLRSPWVEEIKLENEICLVAYSVFSRLSSEGVPLVVSATGFSSAGFSPTFSLGKIDQS